MSVKKVKTLILGTKKVFFNVFGEKKTGHISNLCRKIRQIAVLKAGKNI